MSHIKCFNPMSPLTMQHLLCYIAKLFTPSMNSYFQSAKLAHVVIEFAIVFQQPTIPLPQLVASSESHIHTPSLNHPPHQQSDSDIWVCVNMLIDWVTQVYQMR